MHRSQGADSPREGLVLFPLHAFLRSMGRRVDGRPYEQLRAALTRLERTTIECTIPSADDASQETKRFSIVSLAAVERRRLSERDQLPLFPAVATPDPRHARVTLSAIVREPLTARESIALSMQT